MRKNILLLVLALCTVFTVNAQNKVDNLFFEARGGFMNTINGDDYAGHFTGDFFNLQMFGHITDNVSYRVRQRLNKNPFVADNIFNATDFLYFSWQIDNNWSLDFGKQEIYIGGFEYDYAPIDVYYWSDFCNNIPQSYAFGLTAGYEFDVNNSHEKIMFQVANSPFSQGDFDKHLSYNLIWFGEFAYWWKTIWSVNYVNATNNIDKQYLALGNRFELGNMYLELDYTLSSTDYVGSICGKFNYNYNDKFNFFLKGGYDENSYISMLTQTEFEDTYTYFGGGVEYFPLDNKDLRLHAAYYHDDRNEDAHRIALGATWKLNVINNR